MAASSCCRRAKLQGVESSLTFWQKEAAALNVQSRRWSCGRVKWAAVRRLFSFAVVRQQLVFNFFLVGKDNQSNQKHYNETKYDADTSTDGRGYRGFVVC